MLYFPQCKFSLVTISENVFQNCFYDTVLKWSIIMWFFGRWSSGFVGFSCHWNWLYISWLLCSLTCFLVIAHCSNCVAFYILLTFGYFLAILWFDGCFVVIRLWLFDRAEQLELASRVDRDPHEPRPVGGASSFFKRKARRAKSLNRDHWDDIMFGQYIW